MIIAIIDSAAGISPKENLKPGQSQQPKKHTQIPRVPDKTVRALLHDVMAPVGLDADPAGKEIISPHRPQDKNIGRQHYGISGSVNGSRQLRRPAKPACVKS